jgi:hypothetical protein
MSAPLAPVDTPVDDAKPVEAPVVATPLVVPGPVVTTPPLVVETPVVKSKLVDDVDPPPTPVVAPGPVVTTPPLVVEAKPVVDPVEVVVVVDPLPATVVLVLELEVAAPVVDVDTLVVEEAALQKATAAPSTVKSRANPVPQAPPALQTEIREANASPSETPNSTGAKAV